MTTTLIIRTAGGGKALTQHKLTLQAERLVQKFPPALDTSQKLPTTSHTSQPRGAKAPKERRRKRLGMVWGSKLAFWFVSSAGRNFFHKLLCLRGEFVLKSAPCRPEVKQRLPLASTVSSSSRQVRLLVDSEALLKCVLALLEYHSTKTPNRVNSLRDDKQA